MSKSAEGIVEWARTWRGKVSGPFIEVVLVNEAGEHVENAKYEISFTNGQTIEVKSDSADKIKFYRKTPGRIEIKLLEE